MRWCWAGRRVLRDLLLVVGAAVVSAASAKSLEFPVIDRDFQRYERYLAGRDPVRMADFSGQGLNRHVAELWLFAVAPVLGGCGCRVVYKPYGTDTTNARSVADVVVGRQPADPVAGFVADARYAAKVLFSDAILQGNEFVVGFYTHRERQDVLQQRSAQALLGLRFAVGAHWKVDRMLLDERGWTQVPADDWTSALRLIRAGRADVLLQPFGAPPDLALGVQGLEAEFVPVPGFRTVFGHARHVAFSARHPDGPWLREHFNRGLAVLRRDGRLAALWRAAGVTSEATADWAWVP